MMVYQLVVVDDEGNPHPDLPGFARIWIGPNSDRAGVAFGCLFAQQAAVQVGLDLGALVAVSPAFSESDWLATMRRVEEARKPLLDRLQHELVAGGVKGAERLTDGIADPSGLFDEY